MTARVLPPAEWFRVEDPETRALLASTLEDGAPVLDPKTTAIIAVEDEGRVVASQVLITVSHLEGSFVAETHTGRADVIFLLLKTMKAEARRQGHRKVTTIATEPQVAALCRALRGIKIPQQYAIPTEE